MVVNSDVNDCRIDSFALESPVVVSGLYIDSLILEEAVWQAQWIEGRLGRRSLHMLQPGLNSVSDSVGPS